MVPGMLQRLRPRVTFANVVSLLALFVALGGSSYAALRVTSRDIRNNTVRSEDLRNNHVRGRDIRNSTIRGGDVAFNTLDGRDIREDRLGTVPRATRADSAARADLLGGLGPGAFQRGSGQVVAGSDELSGQGTRTVLELPDLLRVEAVCEMGGVDAARLRLVNLAPADALLWSDEDAVPAGFHSLQPDTGHLTQPPAQSQPPGAEHVIWSFRQGERRALVVGVGGIANGTCHYQVHAITS